MIGGSLIVAAFDVIKYFIFCSIFIIVSSFSLADSITIAVCFTEPFESAERYRIFKKNRREKASLVGGSVCVCVVNKSEQSDIPIVCAMSKPKAVSKESKNVPANTTREFVCGWGASFINICVTYPIYKVMFRQMLHGVEIRSAVNELHQEGFAFLYRGILPPLAQKTISLSLMFGVYDSTKRPLIDCGLNEYLAKCVAGVTAGTVEGLLMPFERIQTLLADSTYHNHFKNTREAFRYVYVNYGVRELFRGAAPILCRNGPSNALFFIFREEAAEKLPHHVSFVACFCCLEICFFFSFF